MRMILLFISAAAAAAGGVYVFFGEYWRILRQLTREEREASQPGSDD